VPLTATPLRDSLGFGARIGGLTAPGIADPAVRRQLQDLWTEHGVLVFSGLPDDARTQIALSEVFGSSAIHPMKQTSEQGEIQELTDIFYRPDRGDIVRMPDGRRLGAWLPWHFDLVYFDRINHGGILRPVALPADGGATGFIDGLSAYERLPDELKAEIEDLRVVYRFEGDFSLLRFGRPPGLEHERMSAGSREVMDNICRFPPVTHPLVFAQPETGRKVLNFSPWFSQGVEGMAQAQSDRILSAVCDHLVDERRAYFHHWRKGEMVLWDNWRIVHCAAGIPIDQARHMQRTTIAGDYGLGRPVSAPVQPPVHA
jgi:taurine dioxygenase